MGVVVMAVLAVLFMRCRQRSAGKELSPEDTQNTVRIHSDGSISRTCTNAIFHSPCAVDPAPQCSRRTCWTRLTLPKAPSSCFTVALFPWQDDALHSCNFQNACASASNIVEQFKLPVFFISNA
jgi:hypothetical protein